MKQPGTWQLSLIHISFLYYYRDKDAREIDLILEQDGKLFPIEIKKMASPPKKLTKVFDLIDKSPLQRGTGAILCMADQLGAFDQNNLICLLYTSRCV